MVSRLEAPPLASFAWARVVARTVAIPIAFPQGPVRPSPEKRPAQYKRPHFVEEWKESKKWRLNECIFL